MLVMRRSFAVVEYSDKILSLAQLAFANGSFLTLRVTSGACQWTDVSGQQCVATRFLYMMQVATTSPTETSLRSSRTSLTRISSCASSVTSKLWHVVPGVRHHRLPFLNFPSSTSLIPSPATAMYRASFHLDHQTGHTLQQMP